MEAISLHPIAEDSFIANLMIEMDMTDDEETDMVVDMVEAPILAEEPRPEEPMIIQEEQQEQPMIDPRIQEQHNKLKKLQAIIREDEAAFRKCAKKKQAHLERCFLKKYTKIITVSIT